MNLLKKDFKIDEYGETSVQIWDLGGQESFKSLRQLYLEGANGGLVIYDVTNRKSFDKLDEWIISFRETRGDEPLLLIGNKIDLKKKIKVSEEEGKEYAEKHDLAFLLTSAKTGKRVETAFRDLIKHILDELNR